MDEAKVNELVALKVKELVEQLGFDNAKGREMAIDEINEAGLQSIGALVTDLAMMLAEGAPISWSEPPENEGLVGRLPGDDESTVEKTVEAKP